MHYEFVKASLEFTENKPFLSIFFKEDGRLEIAKVIFYGHYRIVCCFESEARAQYFSAFVTRGTNVVLFQDLKVSFFNFLLSSAEEFFSKELECNKKSYELDIVKRISVLDYLVFIKDCERRQTQ